MLESRCEVGIGEPESKYNRSLTRDAIRAFVSKDISSFYRSVLYTVELLMYLDKVEGRYNGNYRFFFSFFLRRFVVKINLIQSCTLLCIYNYRHVKIPALNDSQYIGMSVYFVVITSGIVVVLANLMSDRVTLAFVTITALILASTSATLALLFLPQLTNILAGERADPVVQSLGLKIECNTRRFVTDDRT